MDVLWENLPWLAVMGLLVACSAFFSASEAALFFLTALQRRAMASGSVTEQLVAQLLRDPDRLLSAVLFWNLSVNIAYFSVASMVGMRWGPASTGAFAFATAALTVMIYLSEMLPKSLAVLQAPRLSRLVSLPLSVAVRIVDPVMPLLRLANLASRRLIWPALVPEPYLEINDLQRAIEVSTNDTTLAQQETTVLRNVVHLSNLHVQDWMRPRKKFLAFRPPVKLADLQGRLPPSGYVLVTDQQGDEIAAAVPLHQLYEAEAEHLEQQARPVTYIPWCGNLADALQQLQQESAEVAAVVNELGETIGIVTLWDILDAVLLPAPQWGDTRSAVPPIREILPDVWQAPGMTNLRRLAHRFDLQLPTTRHVTLAGVVQESLQRSPEKGDQCQWGPLNIRVLDVAADGELMLQLEVAPAREPES